jgi:DNA-binding NarL/FixJ family response regulator
MRTKTALRVLVVENEELIRFCTEELLRELGHEVVGHATTADAAVRAAALARPDLVLMDVQLDGERDGIDAAREISETFAIPSLFVTGGGTPQMQARALAIHPVGYMMKPVEPGALDSALQAVPCRALSADLGNRSH